MVLVCILKRSAKYKTYMYCSFVQIFLQFYGYEVRRMIMRFGLLLFS